MYTKGEWKSDGGCRIIIEEKEGFIPSPQHPIFVVAQCLIYNTVPSYEEKLANAQLIASAPDLYEALKDLQESILVNVIVENAAIRSHLHQGRERAAKALAKAEGKNE